MTGLVAKTRRIGLLIPSSNTIVETETPRLIPADGSVSLHYSRFRVTVISDAPDSLRQFEDEAMLKAALLLADAVVDCIAWAGTAASWLGLHRDEALVRQITEQSGLAATTAVMAINARLREIEATRIGLVTPYVAALEQSIIGNYRQMGIAVVASERLDLTTNTDYAAVAEDAIEAMVRRVAATRPQAVVIMCTNLRFGLRSRAVSAELGIPVLDSVAVTLDACLG